jgi:hypothetical protein
MLDKRLYSDFKGVMQLRHPLIAAPTEKPKFLSKVGRTCVSSWER